MNEPPPIAPATLHYIFVDFENVQKIDPAVIGAVNVRFTLLMGPLNKKLEMTVVEQLLKHPSTTNIVRLNSSGRNALDFAVTYYVGQAAARDPVGQFHIVSKDKDFDPLIKHLLTTNVQISRHDSFDALALSRSPKSKAGPLVAARSKTGSPAKPKASPRSLAELAAKALQHLRKNSTKPPKTLPKLVSHLRTHLGKMIADGEVPPLIERLKKEGHLTIDAKGVVDYRL